MKMGFACLTIFTLHNCVLASLIVVALKGILFQIKDAFKIWKMSPLDGITWVLTYLAVVLTEIDIGLLVGLCVSLLMIFIQGMKQYTCRLGRIPNTEIYIDAARYDKTEEIPGVCVVHYAGGLNFANKYHFKVAVEEIVQDWSIHHNDKERTKMDKSTEGGNFTAPLNSESDEHEMKYLVLNFSALQYVDPTGSLALQCLAKELAKKHIGILMSGVSGPVYDMLRSCKVFENSHFMCFPTIHDAVLYAQSKLPEVSDK